MIKCLPTAVGQVFRKLLLKKGSILPWCLQSLYSTYCPDSINSVIGTHTHTHTRSMLRISAGRVRFQKWMINGAQYSSTFKIFIQKWMFLTVFSYRGTKRPINIQKRMKLTIHFWKRNLPLFLTTFSLHTPITISPESTGIASFPGSTLPCTTQVIKPGVAVWERA